MTEEKLSYENLDSEKHDLLLKQFPTICRTGYIKCNGCVLPKQFKKFGDLIRTLDIRDDDIWVCTFPKSGSTWSQEVVWCIGHDVDLKAAKKEDLHSRFPFLEFSSLFDDLETKNENQGVTLPPYVLDSVKYCTELPSPRFIRTHLPFNLLPEKLQSGSTGAKIIHVSRNSKDTCVSFYHHSKLFRGYKGSFEQFAELFLEGNVTYGPFFNHMGGYWNQRNNANLLFLKYEEMKKDLKSVVFKIADFIGKSISDDDVEKLLDHSSFSCMKKNPAVNNESLTEIFKKKKVMEDLEGNFMRKGEVGDWKGMIDTVLCERFEKWEKENLKKMDFTFST